MLRRPRFPAALALAALAQIALARPQFEDEPRGPLTVDQFVDGVLQRMKEHNYFSKILVSVDRSQPPLVFFLHKPQIENPGWDKLIVNTHAPWLKKLEEVFRHTYVEPLGWKRRADIPAYAVCELQTQGDYVNFSKAQPELSFDATVASYDRKLRATVAYHELGTAKASDKRYFELAEFVRALLAAHYQGSGEKPAQAWVLEGLGAYLASHSGDDVSALDKRRVSPFTLETLVKASQDPAQRDVYLMPIAELANTRGIDQVLAWMRKRSEQAKLQDLDDALAFYAFHGEAALWMHYLHDGEDARYRPALMKFLTAAEAGNGGFDSFKAAFEGVSLADLDRSFFRWVYAQFEAANPGRKLERRWIDELFATRAGATAAPAAGKFKPSELAPSRDDVATAHGVLLQRARHGDLEGALQGLTDLEARARNGPFGRRIASDIDRVKRTIAMRDAFVADVIASGGKLEFEYEGRKLSVKPVKVENGVVMLADNRQKLGGLPLSQLDPFEMARALPKKLTDGPDGWIRIYPYVLAGDARWKTLLKGDAPEIAALKADALEWYAPVLQLGEAAQRLIALGDAGSPADAAGAQKCLDAIRDLRAQFGELQLVKDRLAALATLAAAALEKRFDPAEVTKALHGHVEDLGDGRLRVTYEFENEAEAKDLIYDATYEEEWRKDREAKGTKAPTATLTIAGGALRGGGSACYRLPIAFEAPLKVTCSLQFNAGTTEQTPVPYFRIAACDDGKGDFVTVANLGGLSVVDRATGLVDADYAPGGVMLDTEKIYEVALAVDGKRATTFVDGAKVKELACGSRTHGGVFFACYGNSALALHRWVIEGKLALEETRASWVAGKLVELGLAVTLR